MYADTDGQQFALYHAERATGFFEAPTLGSPYEAKKIVSGLNLGRRVDIVFGEHGRYDGCYHSPTRAQWDSRYGGHIDLTPSGRTVCVLLHEVAHYLVTDQYFGNLYEIEAHGRQFAWHYVYLVYKVLGRGYATSLADMFVSYNVKGQR
jgi:RimJ/RimL family protein N-acetyltransferase